MRGFLILIARLLYGAIFFSSGYGHFAYAKPMSGYAASKGVPNAEMAVQFTGGMMLTAMFGIVTGLFTRLGAGMLITFLSATNYFMHPFWKVEDPQQKQMEMASFMKNISLIGGALTLALLDGSKKGDEAGK